MINVHTGESTKRFEQHNQYFVYFVKISKRGKKYILKLTVN